MSDNKDTKKPERKPDPWDELMASHEGFLTHLECITEMFSLVLPVLENRDNERDTRLKDLSEEIENEGKKGRRLKSIDDIKEFLDHIRKIKQAERMFRQNIITSIVSKFDEFLIVVLKVAYRANPGWLKNPDKKISYKELLEIESLDRLKAEIIAKEIDSLMRDSHHEQVSFLDSKLKLGIEANFDRWKDFLEITERRNLFVHTGGSVSAIYIENCKKWNVSIPGGAKEGTRLSASDDYISRASDCFYEISVRISQAVARRMFPAGVDELDKALNNKSVDLLISERWMLAERIFEFALAIPKDLRSGQEMEFYFLLNLCIALKFGGKEFAPRLRSVDWTPFHPKYHFAVAVLEDRFADAERLMRSEAVQAEIEERYFKQWPLLREFRKTELFQQAFKDIFKKDFTDEMLEEAKEELKAQQEIDSPSSTNPNPGNDYSTDKNDAPNPDVA